MNKKLTALELHFLLKEFDVLIGGKVDKIYQKEKEELSFHFHVTGKGKKILKILMPSMIYISKYRSKQPDKPPGFCMFLRKHLANARLRKIEQKEFERIIDLTLTTKEKTFHMVIELFSEGNIVICDEDYKILSPLKGQRWKDRVIRAGIKYEYPHRSNNILDMDEEDFSRILNSSNKESVVKALAIDFGLGGIYAEEICNRARIDKNMKKPDEKTVKKLFTELEKMKDESSAGYVAEDDIVPIKLETYSDKEQKEFPSYIEALDETLTEDKIEEEHKEIVSKKEKQIGKINVMIEEQTKRITEIENKIEENTRKGELIFQNYSTIKEITDQINKASEKYDWKEIRKRLKNHEIIKDIDTKNKTITIELK